MSTTHARRDTAPEPNPPNPLQYLIALHLDVTGETLSDVAERGGLPRQTLSGLMHRDGPRSIPRRDTLERLAVGLQTDLDLVERAAALAAASDGLGLGSDGDVRLTALISYARRLDDARLRALITTARALTKLK